MTLEESLIRKEDIGPQNACKEEGEPRQRSVDTAFVFSHALNTNVCSRPSGKHGV